MTGDKSQAKNCQQFSLQKGEQDKQEVLTSQKKPTKVSY